MLLSFVGRLNFLSCDKMQGNEACVLCPFPMNFALLSGYTLHLCSLVSTQHSCPKMQQTSEYFVGIFLCPRFPFSVFPTSGVLFAMAYKL